MTEASKRLINRGYDQEKNNQRRRADIAEVAEMLKKIVEIIVWVTVGIYSASVWNPFLEHEQNNLRKGKEELQKFCGAAY